MDELLVDLEDVDRQIEDSDQAAETGADVVDRDAHAQSAQAFQVGLGRILGPAGVGLGQLQHKPVRGQSGLLQSVADIGVQITHFELSARDVHVHRRIGHCAGPLLGVVACQVKDSSSDLGHVRGGFGGAEELFRPQ